MERFTAQALKSKEKKQHIYEISMQMFAEYGYEQTTIRDICKAADITNSTFYHFFGDKMGVLVQFYYDILSKGQKHLEPTAENLSHPFQSICNFFLATAYPQEQISHDVARVCMMNIPTMIDGSYETLSWNSEILRMTSFLDAAKELGTVPRELDSYKTAEYLIAAAGGVSLHWLTLAKQESYYEVAARLMPTIFSAVTQETITISMKSNSGPIYDLIST